MRGGNGLSRLKSYSSPKAPPPVGPYSAVVSVEMPSTLLFVAGQLPMASDGKIVNGEIKEHTKAVLMNIKMQLEAANASVRDIVKTTVFLANMDHFQDMNEVYAEFFKDSKTKSARATVEVARLPMNALVEIEAIAAV